VILILLVYLDKKFEYQGIPNTVFNIYSDPYFSVNGLFTKFNKNTYVSAASVLFEAHSLIVLTHNTDTNDARDLQILFDDNIISLPYNTSTKLGSCVTAFWGKYKGELWLSTPVNTIRIDLKINANGLNYINLGFELYDIKDTVVDLGGIIGDTEVSSFDVANLVDKNYIEKSLTSFSSPKNAFASAEFCNLEAFKTLQGRKASAQSLINIYKVLTSD